VGGGEMGEEGAERGGRGLKLPRGDQSVDHLLIEI